MESPNHIIMHGYDSFCRKHPSSTSSSNSNDDQYLVRAKQSKFGPDFWCDVEVEKVNSIPNDINGRKVYEIAKGSGPANLSAVSDGRPWKKDSGTQWSSFSEVRYTDCSGSYECINPDCEFKCEYGIVNRSLIYTGYAIIKESMSLAWPTIMWHLCQKPSVCTTEENIHVQ